MTATEPRLSLRQVLSAQTRELHCQTERTVDALDVFSGPQIYRSWLVALYDMQTFFSDGAAAGCEILGIEDVTSDLLDALDRDITAMAGTELLEERPAVGHADQPQPTRSEAIGIIYVLEGSGLGASVLYNRAVEASMPTTEFLDLSRTLAKKRWRRVVGRINELTEVSIEEATAAANSVFSFLDSGLQTISNRKER